MRTRIYIERNSLVGSNYHCQISYTIATSQNFEILRGVL